MINFIISFYARPSQKERFNTITEFCGFNPEIGMYYDESINIYMDEYFWDDHADIMDNKSIYKVILKLNINPCFYHGYYGDEYDEKVYSEIITCERATSFHDLRETLHLEKIVCMPDEAYNKRNTVEFSKKERELSFPSLSNLLELNIKDPNLL